MIKGSIGGGCDRDEYQEVHFRKLAYILFCSFLLHCIVPTLNHFEYLEDSGATQCCGVKKLQPISIDFYIKWLKNVIRL